MIQKINPYHYEHAGPIVTDYIRKLESIADEYSEILSSKDDESSNSRAVTFKVNTEVWDLKKFDFIRQSSIPKSIFYGMESLMRTAKLFMQDGHKYDFNATFLMMYAYPLDVFYLSGVKELFEGYKVGHGSLVRLITKLVDAGYLGVLKKNNYEQKKRHAYYITQKGINAVNTFLKEVQSIEFKLSIYETNINGALREAKRPRGKGVGYVRRHKDIFGEPAPSRFKRKKSRDSNSGDTGQEQ